MYLALEGIKGCGKSTLLQKVLQTGEKDLNNVSFFPITGPMAIYHPMEMQFKYCIRQQTNDDFIEQLFIKRAYWNQPRLLNATIMGDRSIATAIVTRWEKWKDPFYTFSKVKEDYNGIMKPDVIVFIDAPVEKAALNISKRTPKLTGKADEERTSLEKATTVYKELFQDGLYQRKVGNTDIITLPYCENVQEMCSEILSILKFYKQ